MESREQIIALTRTYNISPTMLRGQNFLIDHAVLHDLFSHAAVRESDHVLEIGPGFGALTELLAQQCAHVLAVENDVRLARYLKKKFTGAKHVHIVQGDILRLPNQEIYERLGPYRVIANIPYHITGKVLRKFISENTPKPKDLMVMVQKEVARRICSSQGAMSMLSLSIGLYARPKIIMNVAPSSFWPKPKVFSSVVHIHTVSDTPIYDIGNEESFWRLARIGFSSPRKQLHNNLAAGLHLSSERVKEALMQSGIDERARAQELSFFQWGALNKNLFN